MSGEITISNIVVVVICKLCSYCSLVFVVELQMKYFDSQRKVNSDDVT